MVTMGRCAGGGMPRGVGVGFWQAQAWNKGRYQANGSFTSVEQCQTSRSDVLLYVLDVTGTFWQCFVTFLTCGERFWHCNVTVQKRP